MLVILRQEAPDRDPVFPPLPSVGVDGEPAALPLVEVDLEERGDLPSLRGIVHELEE